MDLTTLTQGAMAIAGTVAVPIAVMFTRRALALAEQRLDIHVSAQSEAAIERAAAAGAGLLTAKLAAGAMRLDDVHLGNQHVEQAVVAAMNIAGEAAVESGLTRDALAARIVGAVGKALGEDPTVPTVPVTKPTAAS